jgi:hypothetical protein
VESIIEVFIEDSISGNIDHTNYLVHLKNNNFALSAFCNKAALIIARPFLNADLSFEDADAVVNCLYSLYIGEAVELPEPADSIHLAFDRGEYAIGEEDPVKEHTRAMLRNILATHLK